MQICTSVPSNELKFWIAISKVGKIGPQKFKLLRNYFSSVEHIWNSYSDQLKQAGLDDKTAEEFVILRREIDPDQELEKMIANNTIAITIDDEHYPKLLKEIHNPPFILFARGNINLLQNPAIAVVGTRHLTHYGKQVTENIVRELVAQNLIVVSGLAMGIDAEAHITTLKNNGTTFAVLASGLDQENIYPAVNRALANEIVNKGGLLISEYPIGVPPLKYNFPMRNRIISGLSLGTLIIEAGESSGALITAKFALDQNREVFAVPGNITSAMSIGTNNLIKLGAKLVNSASDIFEELNLKNICQESKKSEILPDSPEEATVFRFLTEPRHINELVKLTNFSIAETNSILTMMEIKGQIRNIGNNTYTKI